MKMLLVIIQLFYTFVYCNGGLLEKEVNDPVFSNEECIKTAEYFTTIFPFKPNGKYTNWYQFFGHPILMKRLRNDFPGVLKAARKAASDVMVTNVEKATLWYIGGHKNATVARQIIHRSNTRRSDIAKCGTAITKAVVMEPVFHKLLSASFIRNPLHNNINISVVPAGASDEAGYFTVADTGPSTSMSFEVECGPGNKYKCKKAILRPIMDILQEYGFDKLTNNVLYTNCEGCEVPVMEVLLRNNVVQYFNDIMIGTHAISYDYNRRHCNNMKALSKTHVKVQGLQFASERWKKRDSR